WRPPPCVGGGARPPSPEWLLSKCLPGFPVAEADVPAPSDPFFRLIVAEPFISANAGLFSASHPCGRSLSRGKPGFPRGPLRFGPQGRRGRLSRPLFRCNLHSVTTERATCLR